jgi:fumarate hydratase subunit beta
MIKISLPLEDSIIESLKVGDEVLLTGNILVGRDQAHKRLCELIDANQNLPVDLKGQVIYYMGPAPTPQGEIIGSCGPTTSSRMDNFAPKLLDLGLKGMIGKGPRYGGVRDSVLKNKGVYFYAFGGCGALYSQKIISKKVVAFEDLGPEAIYSLEVKDFPVIVAMDSRGESIY